LGIGVLRQYHPKPPEPKKLVTAEEIELPLDILSDEDIAEIRNMGFPEDKLSKKTK
jgi:hypothetical protein